MKKTNVKRKSEKILSITIRFLALVIIFYIARLGYVQVIAREKFFYETVRTQYRDIEIMPKRGAIYDRNGKELAAHVSYYDVWIELVYARGEKKAWDKEEWQNFADRVAPILGATPEHILSIIEENKAQNKARFVLTKKVTRTKMKKLESLKFKPIYFEESHSRRYPYGKFAAHVIGHISKENQGLAGLEAYFNKELAGIPGRKIVLSDAKSHEIETESYQYNAAVDGYNVISTIDEVIQHYVEKAMEQSHYENNSVRSIAIVIDPKTGDILAMCAKPDYNPAEPREIYYEHFRTKMEKAKDSKAKDDVINEMWRNPMVNDIYEPGSVFKAVTASAGIEEGVVAPNSTFQDAGNVVILGQKISNWTPRAFGTVDFKKAVGQSINTVFIEVARRLGSEKFVEYIKAFGFGRKTGIQLPGEAKGIVRTKNTIGPIEQATMSFGQGVSVTPIQMAMAVSAIANDGVLMKPRIVKEITNSEGEIIQRFEPEVVRKPVSKQTNKIVTDLLENVVQKEGGKKAAIKGYRIAGKSGTAQKVINGKYPKGYYISSFVGFAPVEDPKVVVLVITDEPHGNHGIYGGTNSAPFVKMILKDTLRYMGVTPNAIVTNNTNIERREVPELRNISFKEARVLLNQANLTFVSDGDPPPDETTVIDVFPKPGESVPVGSGVVLYFEGRVADEVLMPDLNGKTLAEAERIVTSLGLRLSFSGSGKLIKQFPEPNKLVKKGAMVNLKFEDVFQKPSIADKLEEEALKPETDPGAVGGSSEEQTGQEIEEAEETTEEGTSETDLVGPEEAGMPMEGLEAPMEEEGEPAP